MKKLLIIASFLVAAGPLQAETHAYPVPCVVSRDGPTIQFTNLPNEGSIKIFTITGDQIVSLGITPADAGQVPWHLNNSDGKKVATGVYLYFVEGGGQKTSGKVVVIR